MNVPSDLTDEDFVPFLKSLSVDTYGKSFEWMLNDPDFSGILSWLYSNLDHNNALTPREEYRYSEIEKRGSLLPADELEASIDSLLQEHPGLPLPSDKDSLKDLKQQIFFEKQRIEHLEQHDETITKLKMLNELSKGELNREINKLHALEKQCEEDLQTAAEECTSRAQEVDDITENVADIVGNTLAVYSNAYVDQDVSKKFMVFGPFEAYKQSQSLFKSHFDLYAARKLNRKHTDLSPELEDNRSLKEAKNIEKRLCQAINCYIESAAELSGDQAALALLLDYDDVHPSQIPVRDMECCSAVELLQREEGIVRRQTRDAGVKHARRRTIAATAAAAVAAKLLREELHGELSTLHEAARSAASLDGVLYYALRRELRDVLDLVQYATHLRSHLAAAGDAVAARMEYMEQIIAQQQIAERKLETNDKLVEHLCKVVGVTEPSELWNKCPEINTAIVELEHAIENKFLAKEDSLRIFMGEGASLRARMSEGGWEAPAAALWHALRDQLARMDRTVLDASALYISVKNGDKMNGRKLWQWFLTDRARLLAKVKETQSISCS